MREFATFVPVSPIGHMRVTVTGNQSLCSYMDPDTHQIHISSTKMSHCAKG